MASNLGLPYLLKPNKKVSVFRVTGLKILGREGILFLIKNFSGKNMLLCILKGISPFRMHKIIFFPENLKKIPGFTSLDQVTLNICIFFNLI